MRNLCSSVSLCRNTCFIKFQNFFVLLICILQKQVLPNKLLQLTITRGVYIQGLEIPSYFQVFHDSRNSKWSSGTNQTFPVENIHEISTVLILKSSLKRLSEQASIGNVWEIIFQCVGRKCNLHKRFLDTTFAESYQHTVKLQTKAEVSC